MAAVRANTMQTMTSKRILDEGQPFAATISAARANGRAKIVWENRIRRRNRAVGPVPNGFILPKGVLLPENKCCQPPNFRHADRVPVEEWLLPCVMRLVCFRFRRFFSWLLFSLQPFGVEDAGLVDALVGVRTKEIALRLQEIRWKAS